MMVEEKGQRHTPSKKKAMLVVNGDREEEDRGEEMMSTVKREADDGDGRPW